MSVTHLKPVRRPVDRFSLRKTDTGELVVFGFSQSSRIVGSSVSYKGKRTGIPPMIPVWQKVIDTLTTDYYELRIRMDVVGLFPT